MAIVQPNLFDKNITLIYFSLSKARCRQNEKLTLTHLMHREEK